MPTTLMAIKQSLDSHLGENLVVVAQAGRKKVTRRKGRYEQSLLFHLKC